MNWKTIGKSYTPQVGDKRKIEVSPEPPSKRLKIPTYSRFPFIVGVDVKSQKYWIDQKVTSYEGTKSVEKNHDHRLVSLKLNSEDNPVRQVPTVGKKKYESRLRIYKLLASIEEHANLYISYLHINANLPWWRWRTRLKDEHHICNAILKELHSFAMSNKQRWINTSDSGDFYDLAFLFILILHFKSTLYKSFKILNYTWGWRQTQSNDYLNTYQLEYDFPVILHRRVESEPIFWKYIASVLFMTCKSIPDFIEHFSGYTCCMMREYSESVESPTAPKTTGKSPVTTKTLGKNTGKSPEKRKFRIAKDDTSLIFLITESLLPKFLELGFYRTLVKATQFLLGINLFGPSNVDHICTLDGYKELVKLKNSSPAVVALVEKVSSHVSLTYSSFDYHCNDPFDLVLSENFDFSDFINHIFEKERLEELILRILDIFGALSLNRFKSTSWWYNFVQALPNKRILHGRVLLILSNLIIYDPDSLVYPKLLIQELSRETLLAEEGMFKENRKKLKDGTFDPIIKVEGIPYLDNKEDIYKLIMRIHYNNPEMWTAYLATYDYLKPVSDTIDIFPDYLPLYGLYIYRGIMEGKNVEEYVDALCTKFKLDLDKIKWDRFPISNTHVFSHMTAVCVAWVYKNKNIPIHNAPFLHLLSEFDVKYLAGMLVRMYKGRGILRHLETLLRHIPNGRTTLYYYVKAIVERSTGDRLKRTLGTELIQAQRPQSLRQLERFMSMCTREFYGIKDNDALKELKRSIFDDFQACTLRLGLLSKLGAHYQLLKNLTSAKIPFGISAMDLQRRTEKTSHH